MSEAVQQPDGPPPLRITADGGADIGSLADLLEWFLNYDERTARMRHPMVEELFQWKQVDDKSNGVPSYPFENAEARFAVGSFQALAENDTEAKLNDWISDVLVALQDSRQTKQEISEAYRLDDNAELSRLEKSEKLTTVAEKRIYLTACWIESLCTAEARFLGYVYQELYGKPFTPAPRPEE